MMQDSKTGEMLSEKSGEPSAGAAEGRGSLNWKVQIATVLITVIATVLISYWKFHPSTTKDVAAPPSVAISGTALLSTPFRYHSGVFAEFFETPKPHSYILPMFHLRPAARFHRPSRCQIFVACRSKSNEVDHPTLGYCQHLPHSRYSRDSSLEAKAQDAELRNEERGKPLGGEDGREVSLTTNRLANERRLRTKLHRR
jgi:hypothetical protein